MKHSFKKIILCTSLVLLTISIYAQRLSTEGSQKINTMFSIIDNAYVDDVDSKKIVDAALIALLKELDPHSIYIPKEELDKMNEPLVGNFDGVGIQFNLHKDTIVVVSPISGGPSEKVGVRAGDKIIVINDKTVAGVKFTNQDVMDNLRGPKGSKVTIEVKRSGLKDLLKFEITRDKIPLYSVDASYMVNENIGYIKINRFAATTMQEFKIGLDSLKKQGMQNLILDLRNNSGGYLNTAIELADEFLGPDKLIVYTEGNKMPRQNNIATKRGEFEKGKLVVLIDEGSASASEIVSGAIQDHDRGLIIGRRSFGKGLVQKPFNLPDGSAVRLTISRYYTPSGRCIQRPYENGKDDYYKERERRYESGEYFNSDSIKVSDTAKYYTTNKRVVYGGGGIIPDIFIPVDTSENSQFYIDLFRKGIFNSYTISYFDTKRNDLAKTYTTSKLFNKNFTVYDDLMKDFLKFAQAEGVEKKEEDIVDMKPIENLLKAYFARALFGTSAYFEVINQRDEAFNKAIISFNDGTFKKLNLK
jgi:carboxyl-terminal processing protease